VGVVALVASIDPGEEGGSAGGSASGPESEFEGSRLPPGVRAPRVPLRDQDGRQMSARGLGGQVAIVTFLYTHCRETCPAQAQLVKSALNELGHDVPAFAIAVDPPRDTARSARAFLAKQNVAGRIDFLLGSRRELEPAWRGYAIQPQLPGAEHQARIVLVDRRGLQRVSFPLTQATPGRIAHDVRVLETE
jgi:protein SCO1/2